MRILFLEDNLSFTELMIMMFEARGHTVVHTAKVSTAIHLFLTESFDAVLTDIHLRGEGDETGSGFSLIKEIRNKMKSNVVIAMTTGLELIEAPEAKKRGVDIFHHKPLKVSYDAFIEEIENLVRTRK